jgi:hypothetical protein
LADDVNEALDRIRSHPLAWHPLGRDSRRLGYWKDRLKRRRD